MSSSSFTHSLFGSDSTSLLTEKDIVSAACSNFDRVQSRKQSEFDRGHRRSRSCVFIYGSKADSTLSFFSAAIFTFLIDLCSHQILLLVFGDSHLSKARVTSYPFSTAWLVSLYVYILFRVRELFLYFHQCDLCFHRKVSDCNDGNNSCLECGKQQKQNQQMRSNPFIF